MQNFGAFSTIVRARRRSTTQNLSEFSSNHRVCVLAFLCVCAADASGFTSSLVPGTTKVMKRDSLRRLEIERYSISQSRIAFFARARSRGLSRSQPVFVIIMLEKCMNICVLLMLLLISSLSMIKEKKTKQNFPRLAIIPLLYYLYLYIHIIYILVYYSILRPLLLTVLASLPASLVF